MAYRETTRGLSSAIPVTAGLMAYGRGAYYGFIQLLFHHLHQTFQEPHPTKDFRTALVPQLIKIEKCLSFWARGLVKMLVYYFAPTVHLETLMA